jgi:hypothetical protein
MASEQRVARALREDAEDRAIGALCGAIHHPDTENCVNVRDAVAAIGQYVLLLQKEQDVQSTPAARGDGERAAELAYLESEVVRAHQHYIAALSRFRRDLGDAYIRLTAQVPAIVDDGGLCVCGHGLPCDVHPEKRGSL